jgi:hypothetical protein
MNGSDKLTEKYGKRGRKKISTIKI